ncbi:hypothetical protein F383_34966 [Gossypium arboreum]|uniref:Uncharacterized protein n=1 Tax=Gossypium arboreum TaxID=29729 RepID=A0A0B0N9W0_GOSAR|nr:hypothetical protein F383_34966 [Gossypium arboreum]
MIFMLPSIIIISTNFILLSKGGIICKLIKLERQIFHL